MRDRSPLTTAIPRELEIPELWVRDWSEVISEANPGVGREIALSQARGANMLRNVTDKTFSFARLAWIGLWTRTFWILESAGGALSTNSQLAIEVLARLSFELFMHVESILGAKTSNIRVIATEKERIERLCAYAAWCLQSDVAFQEKVVDPANLDALWSAEPARSIVESGNLEMHEKLFGKLDVELDGKSLRKGRLRQQDEEQHRLHRLQAWLGHPQLAPWKQTIDAWRSKKGNARKTPTFFQVIGEGKGSLWSRLDSHGSSFMYLTYDGASRFLHGSSLEKFVSVVGERVGPRFLKDPEEVEEIAGGIESQCRGVLVVLALLSKDLWPPRKDEASG